MRAFRLSAAALCLSAAFLSFPSAYAAEPAAQEVISASSSYLQSIQWDAEYDVVIAGYGFAGAAAAIAAADAGASVLMVEKAPYGKEGGNSRYAHQGCLFFDPSAPDDELFAYMKAMQNGADNPSDEVIRTYIKETKHQAEYLKKLGADPKVTPNAAEFPDFKGAKYIQRVFVSLPGADGKLYALMQENVEKRASRIDIWYESPAVKLLQDEKTGIVHGMVVKSEGRDRFIRARRGVVLATGGFENNPRMYENYAYVYNAFPKGARTSIQATASRWRSTSMPNSSTWPSSTARIPTLSIQTRARLTAICCTTPRTTFPDAASRATTPSSSALTDGAS